MLSVNFEAPQFGRPPKGNPNAGRAQGMLRVTFKAPKSLNAVADSRGPVHIEMSLQHVTKSPVCKTEYMQWTCKHSGFHHDSIDLVKCPALS